MVFKINVSHKGKSYKVEIENEFLVGKKIGDKVDGGKVDDSLKGFELEITGISDLSGIPGFKGLEGSQYHRRLLTYGPGMKDRRKGMRLRKTNRGEEISLKIHQVNMIVVSGGEGFEDLLKAGGEEKKEEAKEEEKPAEEKDNSERDKDRGKSSESSESGSDVVEDTNEKGRVDSGRSEANENEEEEKA